MFSCSFSRQDVQWSGGVALCIHNLSTTLGEFSFTLRMLCTRGRGPLESETNRVIRNLYFESDQMMYVVRWGGKGGRFSNTVGG